jgi:hypothetical protein
MSVTLGVAAFNGSAPLFFTARPLPFFDRLDISSADFPAARRLLELTG